MFMISIRILTSHYMYSVPKTAEICLHMHKEVQHLLKAFNNAASSILKVIKVVLNKMAGTSK